MQLPQKHAGKYCGSGLIQCLITLVALENGKPFSEANAPYLEFYSGEAGRAYGDVIPSANPANRCFAIRQPTGVVTCLQNWLLR